MANNGKARKFRLTVTTTTDGVPVVKHYSMVTPYGVNPNDEVPVGYTPVADIEMLGQLSDAAYQAKVDEFLAVVVPDGTVRPGLKAQSQFDDLVTCPLPGVEPDEPTITSISCKMLANGCWSGAAAYTLSNGYSSPGNVHYESTLYAQQIFEYCYLPENGTGSACPIP